MCSSMERSFNKKPQIAIFLRQIDLVWIMKKDLVVPAYKFLIDEGPLLHHIIGNIGIGAKSGNVANLFFQKISVSFGILCMIAIDEHVTTLNLPSLNHVHKPENIAHTYFVAIRAILGLGNWFHSDLL